RYLAANDGEPGQSKEKYGKNADDKYYKVPLGTTIKEISTGKIIHQFTSDGEEFIAVEGGAGGIGNMHFSNSRNQYPNFCLLGEPAQTREFELELQLLGDVALIGTPSVGKSSIINACSNTKAKVADYPFTTLIPNLGSVKTHNFSYNIIDIPGLIEGASQGKGLGNDFLRHILKAKVFAFVVDASRYEQGISEIPLLREEIMNYISSRFIESTEYGSPIKKISFELSQQKNKILIIIKAHFEDSSEKIILEKVISFIINKIDLLDGDEEIIEEYEKNLTETILTFFKKNYSTKITSKTISQSIEKVSAASYNGIEKLKDFFGHILQEFETLQSIITIEKIAISKKTTHEITDVTADELSTLKEKEYI
ncbi:MAG TPA: 50S ribosome-binding GTPase, partial [Candidatus Absconditabacterales bacterium]|nr:50S ribosome-binding GTPase [Candidatus Absconditabacterales bacterium]